MKRLHIHVAVEDLEQSIRFYSSLFATPPAKTKGDYAKWMLDDPFLNFSVDLHGDGEPGSAHFGVQQTDAGMLTAARARLDDAALPRDDQDDLVCGYQLQSKSWVFGPDGEAWEFFYTEGLAPEGTYGCEDMPDSCGC